MPDACTSTALHDCAFAGDALRCGELDGLADARWSNVDELAPPALAHPSDALLTALPAKIHALRGVRRRGFARMRPAAGSQ